MVLGVVYKVDPRAIREDLSHAWYADRGVPRPPDQGETVPDREKEGAYSWVKIIGAHCLNVLCYCRRQHAGGRFARNYLYDQAGRDKPGWCGGAGVAA